MIHLEITHFAPEGFKLLGVTWIGCEGLAPFEIDVELSPADDRSFAKTTFRIGRCDDLGRPMVDDARTPAHHVLIGRPRHNRDWAIAIELNPLHEQ